MVWVRNVFLNYENGGETSFLFMGWGRNVFPKYELGAKRLTKKWCELTMGRKVCVSTCPCGNVASVPKAPFISYSRISYFGHACPKLNFVPSPRLTGKCATQN